VESGAEKRQQKPKKRTRASTDAQQTTRNLSTVYSQPKKPNTKGRRKKGSARVKERASERGDELPLHKQQQLHTRKKERKKERKERNSFPQKNTAGTKTKVVFLSASKQKAGGMQKKVGPHRKRKMARIFRKKEEFLSISYVKK
jgi:hypothetical protein